MDPSGTGAHPEFFLVGRLALRLYIIYVLF
jgi:hypothetical protein